MGCGPSDPPEMTPARREQPHGTAASAVALRAPPLVYRPTTGRLELLGEDVKGRYADLKQGSADRCARLLGTIVKGPEVQFHHDVYNQYLWSQF